MKLQKIIYLVYMAFQAFAFTISEFAILFLCRLGWAYTFQGHITMKPPWFLQTLTIHVALRDDIKAELDHLMDSGPITSNVWVMSLVIVKKSTGKLWLYSDF